MAKIIQPKLVVRLDPNDIWNKASNWGFRWHLFVSREENGKPSKTACGMVLESFVTEMGMFPILDKKDMCGLCFKGLEMA